jgi:hypothetical protein
MKKVFLLAVMAVMFYSCITPDTKESIIQDQTKCVIISEDIVKSKLKYPEESEFNTSTAVFEQYGDTSVVLNKFVTKNGFGVKTSATYKVELTFNGGDWSDANNWGYSNLTIESSAGEVKNY